MVAAPYSIAEITLSYRNVPKLSDRPKITQSKDAYAVFLGAWDADKIGFVEEAKVLLLNRANAVLGIYHHSTGGVSGVSVDPKLIFVAALKANACNLILAHNHPSESLAPSRADKTLTEKMKQAGETMEITVLDHLVLSSNGFYSFADDATYDRKDLHLEMDKDKPCNKPALTVAAEDQALPIAEAATSLVAYLQKEFINRALTRSQLFYDTMLANWQDNTLDVVQSFKMFSLDKECRIISLHTLPQGMRFETGRDAEFLMALAARDKAAYIVLAQNKPFGVILPKLADLDFSEMLNAAGRDHDIVLLDYLFVNKNGYYSYNDNEFHLAPHLQL